MHSSLMIGKVITILSYLNFTFADEEDYPFGEFAMDVGSGIMVSQCEKDPSCKDSVGILMLISIPTFIILSYCGCIDANSFDPPKRKTVKRTGSIGLGYMIGKTLT